MKSAVVPLELTFPGGSIYCFELVYICAMKIMTVTGNGGKMLLVLDNSKPSII